MKNLVKSIQINSENYNLIPYTATFNPGAGNYNYKKICSWKLRDVSHWENDRFCFYCKARHSTTGLYMIDYRFVGTAGDPNITITCFMSNKYEHPQIFKWNQETSSIEMYGVTWDWNIFGITLLGNCEASDLNEFIMGETDGQEYASIEELPGKTIEVDYAIMDSGGTMNGSLSFSSSGNSNTSYIRQDTDPNSALQIGAYSALRNVREFTIVQPGKADSWTHVQFKTSSFPYGGDIGVASENWVNDGFLSKTSVSVSGTTLKIS